MGKFKFTRIFLIQKIRQYRNFKNFFCCSLPYLKIYTLVAGWLQKKTWGFSKFHFFANYSPYCYYALYSPQRTRNLSKREDLRSTYINFSDIQFFNAFSPNTGKNKMDFVVFLTLISVSFNLFTHELTTIHWYISKHAHGIGYTKII